MSVDLELVVNAIRSYTARYLYAFVPRYDQYSLMLSPTTPAYQLL